MSTQSAHNPDFIAEMKQILQDEQATLKRELASLGSKSDGVFETNFPEYGRDDENNAIEMAEYAAADSTGHTLEQRLKEVETALTAIQDGTYGTDTHGNIIPEERLRANPAATTNIE